MQGDPYYFNKLAQGQDPKILWFGCGDSRETAEVITGSSPGDIFVHRNIGNIFLESDISALAVLEYAVDHLNITDIIVAAHTHCSAIKVSISRKPLGIIDNWIRRPQDVYSRFRNSLDPLEESLRDGVLSVLNAQQSVQCIARTSIPQKAWASGKQINVHAWLFDIDTGYLYDTKFTVTGPQDLVKQAQWVI
ncbi:hypothetical protein EV182_000208 [Spiromyces aspiralis]|uniref:Uncharacterized protein n=1 Tax=Spiromyces aspiralis TaxID=68401 RepID=A0ACC1HUU3_9FUNG|nr:hypothetical protein EV182_000208 [Spiromyces aspiralis]